MIDKRDSSKDTQESNMAADMKENTIYTVFKY